MFTEPCSVPTSNAYPKHQIDAQERSKRLSQMSLDANLVSQNNTEYSRGDIATYVRYSLRNIIISDLSLVDDLANRLDSFAWTAAACRFVSSGIPNGAEDRLIKILSYEDNSSDLFELILQQVLDELDPHVLRSMDTDPSFARCLRGELSWHRVCELHRTIALRCFNVMARELHFNICRLPTSYLPNNSIPGLEERVRDYISPQLMYACMKWTYHCSFALMNNDVITSMISFLRLHVVQWLEVMSLISEAPLSALQIIDTKHVRTMEFAEMYISLSLNLKSRSKMLS